MTSVTQSNHSEQTLINTNTTPTDTSEPNLPTGNIAWLVPSRVNVPELQRDLGNIFGHFGQTGNFADGQFQSPKIGAWAQRQVEKVDGTQYFDQIKNEVLDTLEKSINLLKELEDSPKTRELVNVLQKIYTQLERSTCSDAQLTKPPLTMKFNGPGLKFDPELIKDIQNNIDYLKEAMQEAHTKNNNDITKFFLR